MEQFVKLSNYAASRGLKTSTLRKKLADLPAKSKTRSGGLWYVVPDAFDKLRMQQLKAKKDSKPQGMLESSIPLAIAISKRLGNKFAILQKLYGKNTGAKTPSHALIAKRITQLRKEETDADAIARKIIAEVESQ